MNTLWRSWKWLVVALAALMPLLLAGDALAFERRYLGEYILSAGWMFEPAYEGQKTAISIGIRRQVEGDDEEEESFGWDKEAGVEGLETTLQVEVTHVPTALSSVMSLQSAWWPGLYSVDLIPTLPGQYRFRVFGAIEGMAVDEVFESGVDDFGNVQPVNAVQFPEQSLTTNAMSRSIRNAQETAELALANASRLQQGILRLRALAIAGIAIGLLGIAVGVAAMVRKQ